MVFSKRGVWRFEGCFKRGDKEKCWPWMAACTKAGYGEIMIDGKMWYAHRLSYTLYVASIPLGLHVLHHCDNRRCVNPHCLFTGTNLDNIADMVTKGRQAGAKGEKAGNVKLTTDQVLDVRRRYRRLGHNSSNCLDLAIELGVTKSCIQHVLQGRNWSHLLEDK